MMTKTYTPTRRQKLKIFFEEDAFEHNVFTPFELCTEIISQVDVSDRNILVMNPEFALVLIEDFGVDPSRITIFADVDPIIENIARRMGINYIDAWNYNMRFDVVFANPPYQSDSKGRAEKLWPKFVAMAFDVTEDNGTVALITPTGWTSGSKNIVKGSVGMLHDYLHKYNVTHIDLDVREHFPGVGSTIGYTITEKKPNEGNTQINGKVIDLSQFDILPAVKKDFDVASSLLEKIFSFESFSLFSSTGGGSNRKSGEDAPTADKTIKTFVRGGNLDTVYYAYFSTIENAKYSSSRKVLIPISGAEKFMPFIDDQGIPYSISCYGVTLDRAETMSGAISVFYSKLFRHLMQHYRTSGFIQIQIAKNLPKVDMSKVWTDDELYAHFGLTQEEIEYVEANV